jgi:ribosome biogenesis GTPase
MTAIAQIREIPVAVVLTKCDLATPEPWLEIYRSAGYPVYCISKVKQNETDDLKLLCGKLQNSTALFAGNSGVGKSTLLNRVLPGLRQQTAEISQKLGRGRHTTRQTEFFRAGSMLIGDSPGFSALEIGRQGIARRELADAFREFAQHIGKCRFPDCAHLLEPGCAVRCAVEEGEIPRTRYRSYVLFMQALQADSK